MKSICENIYFKYLYILHIQNPWPALLKIWWKTKIKSKINSNKLHLIFFTYIYTLKEIVLPFSIKFSYIYSNTHSSIFTIFISFHFLHRTPIHTILLIVYDTRKTSLKQHYIQKQFFTKIILKFLYTLKKRFQFNLNVLST